jgi:hypothetical protein
MQALVDKKVVEHKSVVLWRAKKEQVVSAFDQIRLELFFGSMVFTPVRTESKPPGTDRVLNWAPYGLYQEQSYHLLSAKEVADKKTLDKSVIGRRYRASPKGKEAIRRYNASEAGKQTSSKYEASEGRKQNRRQYEASDVGKENRRQYEASEGRKENNKMQAGVVSSAAGNRRSREFLEAHENNKRHAVQQKTNEPSCGVLGDLPGGS